MKILITKGFVCFDVYVTAFESRFGSKDAGTNKYMQQRVIVLKFFKFA